MIDPSKISVVLLSYARPWNLPIICRSMLDYGFEDIHILDNWQDDNLLKSQFDLDLKRRVNIIQTSYNCRTAARYALMGRTEHPVIATVDDDYCVKHEGWDKLISMWDDSRIVAQIPRAGMQFRNAMNLPFLNIGYGSLFRSEWADSTFSYLTSAGAITEEDWNMFADRIFTTFFGLWEVTPAGDENMIRLKNHDGEYSETDKSSIHLRENYWIDQWKVVMKVIKARFVAREQYQEGHPSLSGYKGRLSFLSPTGYGDCLKENG